MILENKVSQCVKKSSSHSKKKTQESCIVFGGEILNLINFAAGFIFVCYPSLIKGRADVYSPS